MLGRKEKINQYMVNLDSKTFTLTHIEIPPYEFHAVSLEHHFSWARNGFKKHIPEGKLLSENTITPEGFPGREFHFQGSREHVIIRIIAVDASFYVLLASDKLGYYSPEHQDVRRFFDSIQFASTPAFDDSQDVKDDAEALRNRKPNTLTPREIAAGWLLLFDGESTFGLKVGPGERVRVADGALALNGAAIGQPTTDFPHCEIGFEYKLDWGNRGARFGVRLDRAIAMWRDTSGMVTFIHELPAAKEWTAGTVRYDSKLQMLCPNLHKEAMGFFQNFADKPALFARVHFGQESYAQQRVDGHLQVRNIKLKPLFAKRLFNGKDLHGWKVQPGQKATFKVNDRKELTVQGGAGELRTERKFQNFMLQMECISHGNASSGICFRCGDDDSQSGYEIPIRNQFAAEPTREYVMDSFDPQSHNLTATEKVKFTALNYGTGAIDRQRPARKEMSREGEWFGLTVFALNNRLATWVNGVQVTDWYDNRPASNDARNGCRTVPGNIAIRANDSNTNLSFRNVRIIQLPDS
jgi:hypothetical protein